MQQCPDQNVMVYGSGYASALDIVAHEIGHAVLGRGAHSHSGLMLGAWGEQQFQLIRSGLLLFTNLEGHSIRKALRLAATAAADKLDK